MKEENSKPNSEFKLFTGVSWQKQFLKALEEMRDADRQLIEAYQQNGKKYKRRKLRWEEKK